MKTENTALKGKNIIVVGGAGLLGRSLCRAIISSGAACCVIADQLLDEAESLAVEIENEYGNKPMAMKVSIVDKESVDSLILAVEGKIGKIDGLINAAYPRNKQYGRKFEDVTYSDFCENINSHLGGYFLASQRILEYFKRTDGGSLLNISSIYGLVAPRFEIYQDTQMTMPVEYAAIKSALAHLTRYMAKYYAGNNIRVNTLSLGGILDNQPKPFLEKYRGYCLDKGMLDPEDVVGSAVFLMSDASRYINGQNITVDDGFTL